MKTAIDRLGIGTLPVDKGRVAITGNSTGGTISLFAVALDERIALSAPGSYFCNFRRQHWFHPALRMQLHSRIVNPGRNGRCRWVRSLPSVDGVSMGRKTRFTPSMKYIKHLNTSRKFVAVAGEPGECRIICGRGGGHCYYKEGSLALICRYFAYLLILKCLSYQ